MRRLIVLIIAAALCGLAASAQEVSSDKASVEVNATARFDVNPYFPLMGGGEHDFSFGNTSVYTFVDGEFGSGWYYSISNHWLGVDWSRSCPEDKLSPLYSNSLHSDECTWLDWATIGYSLETENAGVWNFSLGKDVIALGLNEFEDNDVDCHFDLSSKYWNETNVYQWGASVEWEAPNEASVLQLQMSSSPYSVYPYQDAKMAFALKWTEERDFWKGMVSLNTMGDYEEETEAPLWWKCLSIGEQFSFNGVTIALDGMLRTTEWNNPLSQSLFTAKIQYDGENSQVSVFAKAGMDHFGYVPKVTKGYTLGFAGIGLYWYPVRDSQDLRLHAVCATSNHFGISDEFDGVMTFDELSLNIGITYNLALHRFWNK